MRLAFCLCLLLLLSGLSVSASAAGMKFIYPASEIPGDTRFNDLIELLRTALEKTSAEYGPFEMGPAPVVMSKARYMAALQLNSGEINIVWTSTSHEMEQQYLPLRIPLRRGLLGYRIMLIHKDMQSRLDQVKTLDDFKKLNVGQGLGWNDSLLYEGIGMQVTRAKYGNLFAMTALKRFDVFPRGVNEIFQEHETHSKEHAELAIEKNLLLYYPWPYYFFFNKQDQARARRVEAGLRKMLKDGSFDSIFQKYHAKSIAQANLKGRRLLRLQNPLLPKETPLADSSLWFDASLPMVEDGKLPPK